MGKTQSYLRGKLPASWGKEAPKQGGLSLVVNPKDPLQDGVLGTIYGNCIGDAIGLLTEFLTKEQATKYLSGKHVEYSMKRIVAERFIHQMAFPEADWTDDSDQMILILQSLMENNGKANAVDFAKKLFDWREHGFPELGDTCGMGVGQNTWKVLSNVHFKTDPHKAAHDVWENSRRYSAPNGGVMRTSIVGIHRHNDIEQVISNTKTFCQVTHADPRCVASCVAVTTAIAMMLQGRHRDQASGKLDVEALTGAAFEYAKECLLRDDEGNLNSEQVKQLRYNMYASLDELELGKRPSIGYTLKCLGAGFWALRQKNFRNAIQELILEGGDADTNGAVAGALLGCKLGYSKLPSTWRNELKHKQWLDDIIASYLQMGIMVEDCGTPVDAPTGDIFSSKSANPQPGSEGEVDTSSQPEAAAATAAAAEASAAATGTAATAAACSDRPAEDPKGVGVGGQDGAPEMPTDDGAAGRVSDDSGDKAAEGQRAGQGSANEAASQAETPDHADTIEPSEATEDGRSSGEAGTGKEN